MAVMSGIVNIYSNDGSEHLGYIETHGSVSTPHTVSEKGFVGYEILSVTIIGYATEPNATTPTYKIGDTITVNPGDEYNIYIVEQSAPTDGVTIEYNNTVIASLKAGQSATLQCKNTEEKPNLMKTDIIVTVPEGMGAGEVVEEWDGSIEVV